MSATPLGTRRCDWGVHMWTAEDDAACQSAAVGIVAVRSDAGILKLDVCPTHREVLIDETDPLGLPA